jgi:hypothetical protein
MQRAASKRKLSKADAVQASYLSDRESGLVRACGFWLFAPRARTPGAPGARAAPCSPLRPQPHQPWSPFNPAGLRYPHQSKEPVCRAAPPGQVGLARNLACRL